MISRGTRKAFYCPVGAIRAKSSRERTESTSVTETQTKTKPAHSKNPSDRGTRGIINKINQRLSREDITDEQFEKWVALAVELRKRVGMAGKPKERHPRLDSDQDIFTAE